MNQIPVTEMSQMTSVLIWLGCLIVGAAVGSLLIDLKEYFKGKEKKDEG